MYEPTEYYLSPYELTNMLTEALARVPVPSGSSFMVFYPFVPDCLAHAHVLKTQLVGLLPSQQIVAHQDAAIQGVRYHLPLQVNRGCWVFHGEHWQQVLARRIYQMDPTVEHGAVNWGDTVRLHLIIDVESPA